jgi:hypothetical protein
MFDAFAGAPVTVLVVAALTMTLSREIFMYTHAHAAFDVLIILVRAADVSNELIVTRDEIAARAIRVGRRHPADQANLSRPLSSPTTALHDNSHSRK